MNLIDMNKLIEIARTAGKEIMDIYQTDFKVDHKEDHSPLTEADRRSHAVIVQALQTNYPNIPILSEEGKTIPYDDRKNWTRFWLVDPIDGTKEFIKRNGEFTVNIALIENQFPVLGVIYAPALNTLYVGQQGKGAYKIIHETHQIQVKTHQLEDVYTIVESRSHPSAELNEFIKKIELKFGKIERIEKGSSLKLCAVAEGAADCYPRFGPTMEWDTAAGQAIVEAAGGKVLNLKGERFIYNKESLLNESFLAFAKEF